MPQSPSEVAAGPVDLLAEAGPTRQVPELDVVGVVVGRDVLLPTLARGSRLARWQAKVAISTPDLSGEAEGLQFWRCLAVGSAARQLAAGPGMAPPTLKAAAQAFVEW